MTIKAIILAAGIGSRMAEMTKDTPKVMLRLNEKPIIQYQIEMLKNYGVKEVCINLHYMPEKIKEFLGNGEKFGIKIHYSYEPELLGTSGALLAFKKILTEDFFVIYGDVIGKVDLKRFYDFHKKNKADATLIVHESTHPEDSDIIQVKENRIIKLIHKPGNRNFGTLGNAAWYILSPIVFDFIPEGKSDFVRDVFPKMLEKGLRLYAYNTNEFISDVGTPERFKKVQDLYERIRLGKDKK
ncbi:MAG: nucleotidyltransferase family protein [Candidatus Pacearchaeota archaeon]